MLRQILLVTIACLLAGSIACSEGTREPASTNNVAPSPEKTVSKQEAVALAQKLHDDLNRLETAGDLEGQAKYFHDSVTRMEPFRPMIRGKDQWLSLQKNLRTKEIGFKVESISTRVVDAWQQGDRLYEFGTAEMNFQSSAGGGRDPIDYFIMWRINPATNPQIEFIIWNTTQPIEQLKTLATAGTK